MAKQIFFGFLESASLSVCQSVHPSVRLSVRVQNTSLCQSTGGCIKSYLMTTLDSFRFLNSLAQDNNFDMS